MPKTPDLHIEVQEKLRRIIVTMPRTTCDATFGLIERGLCLMSGFGPNDGRAQSRRRVCDNGEDRGNREGA